MDAFEQAPVVCAVCGRVADDPDAARVTWSLAREGEGEQWACADCTRAHARGIEARLDAQWW